MEQQELKDFINEAKKFTNEMTKVSSRIKDSPEFFEPNHLSSILNISNVLVSKLNSSNLFNDVYIDKLNKMKLLDQKKQTLSSNYNK